MLYKYDLFVSYSSGDRAWAAALQDALKARNVSCFLDDSRLVKGEQWEKQLIEALEGSRHFLVIWSARAQASNWVQEELVRFKQFVEAAAAKAASERRLLYALNLEGENAVLARYQGFKPPLLQAAYAASRDAVGLDAAATTAWTAVMEEVAAGVRSDQPALEVPVAVLALTVGLFDKSLFAPPEFDFLQPGDMDDLLGRLGIEALATLSDRYGASAWEWRPYGTPQTIAEVLERLRSDARTGINAKLGQFKLPPIKWKAVDVLTPPENQLERIATEMCKRPCVLVVDPLSLFNLRIYKRYVRLGELFASPNAAVLFPSPLGTTDSQLLLRECLAELGTPNLRWFHEPIPFRPGHAACGLNVADPLDLRRLVLACLASRLTEPDPFLHA